jgi:hypothetical protein
MKGHNVVGSPLGQGKVNRLRVWQLLVALIPLVLYYLSPKVSEQALPNSNQSASTISTNQEAKARLPFWTADPKSVRWGNQSKSFPDRETRRLDREQHELDPQPKTRPRKLSKDELEALLKKLKNHQAALAQVKDGKLEELETVKAKAFGEELELYAEGDSDNLEQLFSDEELAELAEQGARVDRDGMLFGTRVSSGGGASADVSPTPEPSPTPDDPNAGFYVGQTRGMTMLYLMHQSARAAVEVQVDTLLRSKVSALQLGVLVDGTFDQDFAYLQSVIRRLNSEGRTLTLVVYLTNGPTMRRWDTTPISAGFARIEPSRFRELIKSDSYIQDEYRDIVQKSLPIFQLNRSLNPGNRNLAIVMLEDNLDATAYRSMRDIAFPIIGGLVEFVRNPCVGCYSGNDDQSFGDAIEYHVQPNGSIPRLDPRSGVTLDGSGYKFDGEFNARAFSMQATAGLLDISLAQGLHYFSLWRWERQGFYGTDVPIHPDDRIYEVSSPAQATAEIDLLRYGLEHQVDEDDIEADSEVVSG